MPPYRTSLASGIGNPFSESDGIPAGGSGAEGLEELMDEFGKRFSRKSSTSAVTTGGQQPVP
jgi:hypothetical protein